MMAVSILLLAAVYAWLRRLAAARADDDVFEAREQAIRDDQRERLRANLASQAAAHAATRRKRAEFQLLKENPDTVNWSKLFPPVAPGDDETDPHDGQWVM